MVERVGANILEEFEGRVIDVVLEKNQFADSESDQFHVTMEGLNIEVKGKTGVLHEWIRLSPKTTQESIPEGSIIDKYLTQLEIVLPEAKKAKTLNEAFGLMKGKVFLFKKIKLGKAFEGHPARAVWLPVQIIKAK
jgi:hypothetical protein